jgi:cold shock CspA family protein
MASSTATLTGCVKWFNNKLNYGFITVLSDGEYKNVDIFVHQSNIKTARDCFRTLNTGECVQFSLAKTDDEAHPIHAVNVSGFNGNGLSCENTVHRPRVRYQQGRPNHFNYRPRDSTTTKIIPTPTTSSSETTPAISTCEMVDTTTTATATTTTTTEGRGSTRGRGRGRGSGVRTSD